MVPVCPTNHILVTIDKRYDDEIHFESGVKLYKDVTYKPEHHATIIGRVQSVPNRFTDHPDYKSLVPFVNEGDEIIFSYLVVSDIDDPDGEAPIHRNHVFIVGGEYWKVEYSLVLGKMIEGEPVAGNGFVFMQPDEDDLGELTVGGLYIPEIAQKKEAKNRAKVLSFGDPLRGAPKLDVRQGDTVVFDGRFVERYDINNKEYRVLAQSRVLGKLVYA